MRIAATIALILIAVAIGFGIWGSLVTNGSGSADERVGGAYLYFIAAVFAGSGILAGIVALAIGAFG